MNVNCRREGTACTMDGILHDQLLSIWFVPNVNQAAMIDPKYQVVLYMEVKMGRSWG
jgi:hypothetical protein